jgi:inner membrane protein
MSWWTWVLLGVALLVVEMATPGGLFALFFGLGALAVGLLAALELGGPAWMQWALFALLSVALLAVLRKRLRGKLGAPGLQAELTGEVATLLADLPAGGVGRAELRGTPWEVRADGGVALGRGQRCRVVRVEGLALVVRPE